MMLINISVGCMCRFWSSIKESVEGGTQVESGWVLRLEEIMSVLI